MLDLIEKKREFWEAVLSLASSDAYTVPNGSWKYDIDMGLVELAWQEMPVGYELEYDEWLEFMFDVKVRLDIK